MEGSLTTRSRLSSISVAVATCLALVACAVDAAPPKPVDPVAIADARVDQVIAAYVTKTRGWPRDSYLIERNENDGFYTVMPKDEAARLIVGCDQAFGVEIDAASPRVVKEWGCQ